MGTRMAPSYANIFMDSLERRILAEEERIPSTWWRYTVPFMSNVTLSRETSASDSRMAFNYPRELARRHAGGDDTTRGRRLWHVRVK